MMSCFRRAWSPVARADRFDTGCCRDGPVYVGLAVTGFPFAAKTGALGLAWNPPNTRDCEPWQLHGSCFRRGDVLIRPAPQRISEPHT